MSHRYFDRIIALCDCLLCKSVTFCPKDDCQFFLFTESFIINTHRIIAQSKSRSLKSQAM